MGINRLVYTWALIFLPPSLCATTQTKTVRIGIVANFSEISSSTSNPYFGHLSNGILLATEDSKIDLKKQGIRIEVVKYDYGGKKERLFKVTEEIQKDKIQILYGFIYSSHALLGAQLLAASDVLIVNSTASASRLDQFDNFLRTSFSDTSQGKALSNLAKKNDHKRVAIFSLSNCSYCQSLAQSFQSNFNDEAHRVVIHQKSLNTKKAIDRFFSAIRKTSIDAIFIPNHERDSAVIINALIKKGGRCHLVWWRWLGQFWNSVF